MQASDIANGAMKHPTYLKWSTLLMQEFNHQVHCEEKNKLPPTNFVRYTGMVNFYKGQLFFLGNKLTSHPRRPIIQSDKKDLSLHQFVQRKRQKPRNLEKKSQKFREKDAQKRKKWAAKRTRKQIFKICHQTKFWFFGVCGESREKWDCSFEDAELERV